MADDDLPVFFENFPDRVERGQDGVDLSRIEPGVGLVYTGLGGVGQALRYIVIAAALSPPLDTAAQPDLEIHWQQAAHAHRAEVEAITLKADYVQVTLLIPLDVAPDDVVQAGLHWRWAGQPALNPEYYITNVASPTEEEIAEFLEEYQYINWIKASLSSRTACIATAHVSCSSYEANTTRLAFVKGTS